MGNWEGKCPAEEVPKLACACPGALEAALATPVLSGSRVTQSLLSSRRSPTAFSQAE